MDQLQLLRQQLIEAMAQDRMGLAAADLHQRPGPGDLPPQLSCQLMHQLRPAEAAGPAHRLGASWGCSHTGVG